MKRILIAVVALVAIIALPALAGEWHSGNSNVCTDCHTMHFSQSHNWDASPTSTTPKPNGNWLGASGPNNFLLKAPANALCKGCHDSQTFAPDVFQANSNGSPANGRSAGAVTSEGDLIYKGGHPLDSTMPPPGWASARASSKAASARSGSVSRTERA